MAAESARDESFKELWHACAGANLRVPEAGERVFYLPQVHLAQVEANTANDGEMPVMDNPFFKLPPKILCTVVNLQQVEPQTDEVFALITLQPELEQESQASRHGNFQSLPQAANECSFVKLLTASDTNTHGLTVPKRDALKWLPRLESEWLRLTLHKWLDDEYCPEETNVEISKVAARSLYNSLLEKEMDIGVILLKMARDLESINYQESFHGAYTSANAAIDLVMRR